MTLTQAIVLGAVHGMTEFLPISSSAHLILVPLILSWRDQGLTFDVVLHAGTLIAILSVFWKNWLQMVSGAFQADRNLQRLRPVMLFLILCGTVPAVVAGFLAQKTIETTFRSPFILSITLSGVARLLASLSGWRGANGLRGTFPYQTHSAVAAHKPWL